MIIQSLLDTDLYKFTMMQAVLHHFPSAQAEYRFICRTPEVDLRPLAHAIHAEVEQLAALRLTDAERGWLASLPYFSDDFIEHLAGFRFDPHQVSVRPGNEQLEISVRGPWQAAILFEVPLLAIVNETWFRACDDQPDYSTALMRLDLKAELMAQAGAGFSVTEFGTRRRFSRPWHEEALDGLRRLVPQSIAGTSNMDLARRLKLAPQGTMAHEYLQACQVLAPSIGEAQVFALNTWLDEYKGELGTALTDTYGLDAFLADFDERLARAYTGVRHDSGDPFAWTERMLAHYAQLGIDPREKTLIYSNSLTVPQALEIFGRFHGRARLGFGIGTNLTNDVGLAPLDIVIKMTHLNGHAVAKLSDEPGKEVSPDPEYLDDLRDIYRRKIAV
ncbi:MAG: nicotinate phosphoribosyltransferase [Gammaproteobacteria bacterium]|nr:nicotinate phosphoribosyltransferase [Gammaproteobacteria bacterium]